MRRLAIKNQNLIRAKIKSYLSKNAESRFVQRLMILQYIIEHDQSSVSTAQVFNVSARTILNWVNKINETGDLESIRDKPGKGRKTQLTSAQLDQIKRALYEEPNKSGIKSEKWNGKSLARYITRKLGIKLQSRQSQRLLAKFGFANKPGRPKET
jgi:transposase